MAKCGEGQMHAGDSVRLRGAFFFFPIHEKIANGLKPMFLTNDLWYDYLQGAPIYLRSAKHDLVLSASTNKWCGCAAKINMVRLRCQDQALKV